MVQNRISQHILEHAHYSNLSMVYIGHGPLDYQHKKVYTVDIETLEYCFCNSNIRLSDQDQHNQSVHYIHIVWYNWNQHNQNHSDRHLVLCIHLWHSLKTKQIKVIFNIYIFIFICYNSYLPICNLTLKYVLP